MSSTDYARARRRARKLRQQLAERARKLRQLAERAERQGLPAQVIARWRSEAEDLERKDLRSLPRLRASARDIVPSPAHSTGYDPIGWPDDLYLGAG